jgi:hypothetical protein
MIMRTEDILGLISQHPDPIIRWKSSRNLFGKFLSSEIDKDPKEILSSSPIIKNLLIDQKEDGRIPYHPYDKWFGAHWLLSILADLEFPPGNEFLKPLLDQCYEWLLSTQHQNKIKIINGRTRRCASQEGNCIYYSTGLGLADDRTDELVARLIKWQWEDGGWNCDKRPEAINSSFNESLIPLRGLAWYTKKTDDPNAKQCMNQAAEFFLKRHLYKRIRDNQVIDQNFTRLHYPNYWHYDILFALKVMAEAGFIMDPRCQEALELLESKRLPDGGFPAEGKYYRVDHNKLAGHSRVDWGGTSKTHANMFVTLDAMFVLNKSGRLVE